MPSSARRMGGLVGRVALHISVGHLGVRLSVWMDTLASGDTLPAGSTAT